MALTKVTYSMIEGATANVLDFGAIGSGLVDDTAAIQAAVNSLPSAGGSVYFPSGIYLVNSGVSDTPILVNKNNVTFYGAGASSVIKKTVADRILIQVGSLAGVTEGNRIKGFQCFCLKFDGNSVADTSNNFPMLHCQYVEDSTVSFNTFVNFTHGLRFGRGSTGFSLVNQRAKNSQATNNIFENGRNFGIELFSVDGFLVANNTVVGGALSTVIPCIGIRIVESVYSSIVNNVITNNGRGIAGSSINDQIGIVIRGNTIQGTTTEQSLSIAGPTQDFVIEDNVINGDGAVGSVVAIGSSGGSIFQKNLVFRKNQITSSSNTTSVVRVDFGDGVEIVANTIKNANTTTFGVNLVSCDGYCLVARNTIELADSAAFAIRDTSGLAGMTIAVEGNSFNLADPAKSVSRGGGTLSVIRSLNNGGLPVAQTINTDATFTLTPFSSPEQTFHTGTLTADRAYSLSAANAYDGARFIVTRTGGGAFNLTNALKNIATNEWAEFYYDGTASDWRLASFGSL